MKRLAAFAVCASALLFASEPVVAKDCGQAELLVKRAAQMKVLGFSNRQECGRWLNNRAENSHQPFRRREGAMARFRDIKTLQKFAAAHASIHNHFNLERHLTRRETFKQNRAAALAEWRQLSA